MALFEGYERKIDKINGVLAQYGLDSTSVVVHSISQSSSSVVAYLRYSLPTVTHTSVVTTSTK